MSFITKRERVFNEYDLFDLPARNEGKLKAYASCTDARAWSHFCSDKTEHLVEIIKKNNETCRPKYVPTEAIVNTLLANKHAEIARLKRKIEEFEQMLAAYDDLDLTCEQKCEIAKAHAAIKEANKDLTELWFDLDLSGFTGIDSEDFETGKSRGDEPSKFKEEHEDETPRSKGDEWSFEKEHPLRETKSNQAGGMSCYCDAGTNAVDPRIEELQESLIYKDAKLNAMKNSMAVMENDVCEPYCIYAHIYTALEKIFGILCQNDKYKLYLDLMTSGKNTRCLDIKGKILFKLKVLEKFNIALIAPCSQDFAAHNAHNSHSSEQECPCYRAEVMPRIETTYALTSAESQQPFVDSKRAQMVADIMANEEMKEILDKKCDTFSTNVGADDVIVLESYNINQENLERIKNLQENYDELMTCYESLKVEKDKLLIRCKKYEDLEKEFEDLQTQLREYKTLWNEKEHYRKRSLDLDTLKEQYLLLCDETTNLETKLKVESEINNVKSSSIEELRNQNVALEKKLNDATIAFEKKKNSARCKLKESECTIMCQGQQIRSLSLQIDKFLEQDIHEDDGVHLKQHETSTIVLMDKVNLLEEQSKNLRDALFGSDEEKQQLQEEYQNKLNLINALRIEIEDCRADYEKTLQRNDYLEKYTDSFRDEVQKLLEENNRLLKDVEEKTRAIDNLNNVLKNKSQEVNLLMEDVDRKNKENSNLNNEIHRLHDTYKNKITALDSEKLQAIKSLQIANRDSHELLEKVKDYDKIVHQQDSLSHEFQDQSEKYNQLEALQVSTKQENERLQTELASSENANSILMQEIERLLDKNNFAASSISSLQDKNKQYELSLDLTKKDSKILENKVQILENLTYQIEQLKGSHEKLIKDKNKLENELSNKTIELDKAIHKTNLTKKENEVLGEKLQYSDNLKADLENLKDAYKQLINDKQHLLSELNENKLYYDDLSDSFNSLKALNDETSQKVEDLSKKLEDLKNSYNTLLTKKDDLQNDLHVKSEEIKNLHKMLGTKIDENRNLYEELTSLRQNHEIIQNNMNSLQLEHSSTKNVLNTLKKDSNALMDKVKYYETLELEYDRLKKVNDKVKEEKVELQAELLKQLEELKKIEKDNLALNSESQSLLSHSDDLEKALINARTRLIGGTSCPESSHMDIIKEIEEMKKEKLSKHNEIRNLLDKLDESENIISSLSEDILARDDKIAILENHINELQDEVKRLHSSLEEIIDTGEQIKENSYQRIRESLNTMEAHHSKATHNMKMELAKLQTDNRALVERLSVRKMKNEDSARDKHKYLSTIAHLQNEREFIVTDIKQLELSSVGDSALSPENCEVEDIVRSLDRIRRYLDARSSKSTSLEQTLLKVQNSYQVVQNKADEAKKIVEKEKQKILNEKEEAIRDRHSMERQLTHLKEQLEKQVTDDKNMIKDLEAEILNQKLISDKLNQSTQSYIAKLKEEIQSLKEIYNDSLEKISALEKKLILTTEENNSHMNLIKEINITLQDRNKEVDVLNKILDECKNKMYYSQGIQVLIMNKSDKETQTNEEMQCKGFDEYYNNNKINVVNEDIEFYSTYAEKPSQATNEKKSFQREKTKLGTEVRVLTASIETEFDYVRNCYINYKLNNLSLGPLEHDSYSCTRENDIELNDNDMALLNIKNNKNPTANQTGDDMNVIDIYNKQSIHTNSSKNINSNDNYSDRNPDETTAIKDLSLTIDNLDTQSSTNKASTLFGTVSGLSTSKDLFVLYRDSEISQDNGSNEKKSFPMSGQSEEVYKAAIPDNYNKKQTTKDSSRKNKNKYDIEKDLFLSPENEELIDDDSVKHKLKISLPRVEVDISNLENVSDVEKKSINSSTINVYPLSKSTYSSENKMVNALNIKGKYRESSSDHSTSNDENFGSKVSDKNENKIFTSKSMGRNNYNNLLRSKHLIERPNENNTASSGFKETRFESSHTLSRIDADLHLIKNKVANPTANGENIKNNNISIENREKIENDTTSNFGLNYILATAQMDPENIKMYNAADSLRKARSGEFYNAAKLKEIDAGLCDNQSSFNIQTKTYTDIGINTTVKLDLIEEYESKLKYLTEDLENIKKHYKKKIEAIKTQYDSNIKSILNEHNEGVKSIQSLHEDTLQDINKHHENEVENLRSMSIEAMRKADKLEKECRSLKCKFPVYSSANLDEEPVKKSTSELRRQRKSRIDAKTLSKTKVEAFNVEPKSRSNGPCTCSLDVNLSDTIRNIFEQVDVEQRKKAEHTYLKYIANKMLHDTVEALDCHELSFLHLKVCRIWKIKLTKEEALQKRIDSLEAELMSKHWDTKKNIVELDRKVTEERRRLQEVREAVCRNVPTASRFDNSEPEPGYVPSASPTPDKDFLCSCNTATCNLKVGERRSAGDLAAVTNSGLRSKRTKPETNRALTKLDAEERREKRKKEEEDKKLYTDELPTRLRRAPLRSNRK